MVKDFWQTLTIGELCDEGGGSVQTGPFGSQLHAEDYVADGVPFVMPTNLGENRIVENEIARISVADTERLSRYRLRTGDIIYGRRGDIGRRALVTKREDGWMCGSGCIRIRFGEAEVEPRFVSFYLGQSRVKELILTKAVGSTMPNLNSEIIRSIPISFPPLPIQRRIADILGALDDKIECNRRINQTLEAMAQALYKHWFVDFGPFRGGEFVDSELGEIPQGWEVKSLLDCCNLLSGGTPSTSVSEYWNGEIPWVAAKDISQSEQIFVMETEKKITSLGVKNSATKILPIFTVVIIARGATMGKFALFSNDMAMNQTSYGLRGKTGFGQWWVYLTLDNIIAQLKQAAYGTIFTAITTTSFQQAKVVVPLPSILDEFNDRVSRWFTQIHSNLKENQTLTRARDYLLPKLLSGEVEIKDTDSNLEAMP